MSWISSTLTARFSAWHCSVTSLAMDRICSWVRLLLRLTESLALVTAVMILVISNGTSEPLRLMIFIVFLRRSICVQFKRVPLSQEAPAKQSWDAFNWCDSMISLFSDMSMEKPLHFVFWRFRQNWAKNLGAKFEAKALDKLCKESVCIPGRNIHGGVYFSGSLDRTIPYYIEKNDLWGPCSLLRQGTCKLQLKN